MWDMVFSIELSNANSKERNTMRKKIFHILLVVTLIPTLLVPLTGIHVHKLASTLFLLLCFIHTIKNRKRMGVKKYVLLSVVIVAFVSGLFGMIYEELPMILALHKVISILAVAILAIHMFVYRKRV